MRSLRLQPPRHRPTRRSSGALSSGKLDGARYPTCRLAQQERISGLESGEYIFMDMYFPFYPLTLHPMSSP